MFASRRYATRGRAGDSARSEVRFHVPAACVRVVVYATLSPGGVRIVWSHVASGERMLVLVRPGG